MGVTKGKRGGQNKSKSLVFFCYLLSMFTDLRNSPPPGIKTEVLCSPIFSHTFLNVLLS